MFSAYFFISGFNKIYKPLEKTEKIRILIGIGTSQETYDFIKTAETQAKNLLHFSHSETKQQIESKLESEISNSENSFNVEEGVIKFIEWIREGKIEIRGYPT